MADLFDGRSRQAPLVGRLYRLMTGLMRPLGRYLMEQPVGDGFLAGPTFEHRDLGTEPAAELAELAQRVVAGHPALTTVLMPLKERHLG